MGLAEWTISFLIFYGALIGFLWWVGRKNDEI